ncbi:dephospho-CoA kinase [Aquibacillus rhizosphaerae]|uniref:Dephospho-CoA kinase n=1 Tax=Aquibacillus rhizosphaerae TaxID=3051431 RepID=A0ABT7L623_9BACI|nr:dephospho-CoA kinase [Aquibacillus sp. LR5S19]MDL4840650.1 dephospho-CoA kinase [Aquibacillus sp. LR5S19]
MVLIIGLTGSIATGKSTVARMLINNNIPVIDADIISRKVVEPGEPAYFKIIETFGTEILEVNEKIDRKKLGRIIFSDELKRKQLNEIVHPAVRETMLQEKNKRIKLGEEVIVLDIPLLFESKLTDLVDKIVVVYVEEQIQLARLMERDKSSQEDALKRIRSQMSIKQKAEMADQVIDNSGTLKETEEQLQKILTMWNIYI